MRTAALVEPCKVERIFKTRPRRHILTWRSAGWPTLVGLATCGALLMSACGPSQDEIEAKERADKAAAKQRVEAEQARATAEREAKERAATARRAGAIKKWRASRAERAGLYATMTDKEREKLLREHCQFDGVCDRTWEVIVQTARSDAERKNLEAIAEKLCGPCEIGGRDRFVGELARDLVARGSVPSGMQVDAAGPDKRYLTVKGSFCSEEFLSDVVDGMGYGLRVRDAGFKQVSCSGGKSSAVAKVEE